ncbi:MAG: AMP-binding protein, partial [Candidatus Cloacimonadota bacterium]|nr:AMP-binding protein [Candidatus Cloacimonadota bacterium]
MMKENFVELVEKSIKENWVIDALSNFEKEPLKYGEVAAKIAWFHNFFVKSNIKKGDKVALIGKNSVNWAVTYLATITYGAVIVPILPDFNADDVHHIVNHSDSKLFFCSESIYEKLDGSIMRNLDAVFNLEDLKLLFNRKKGIKHILEKSHDRSLKVFAESFSLP